MVLERSTARLALSVQLLADMVLVWVLGFAASGF